LEVFVNIQKIVRNVLNALLLSVFLLDGNVFAADKWLNPAPYPVGMDTWFGNVYNKTAQHDYRNRVGGWGDQYSSLLRFDLGGLPQVATNAYIWRYTINEGAPTAINWWKVNQQWQSSTVGYSNFPWGTLLPLWATPAPSPGYWYIIDITSIYNQWRTGPVGAGGNYGLLLSPATTNNNFSSFYSSTQGGGYGPWLQVTYTPQANDGVIKLKWPLSVSRSSLSVSLSFTGQSPITCSDGYNKEHNGVDYTATAGTEVYAAEDGFIKKRATTSSGNWGGYMAIEHNHPSGNGAKYTTLYWHISPVSGIAEGDFVPKGMKIATVLNLAPYGHGTHFHFGIRIGAYNPSVSNLGALPYANHPCDGYPVFPAGFINPENDIIFQ
jgi:murein DD-endopeptidase MepM/ murein hydrolase activator NlpD